jgi:hypothetical protein
MFRDRENLRIEWEKKTAQNVKLDSPKNSYKKTVTKENVNNDKPPRLF